MKQIKKIVIIFLFLLSLLTSCKSNIVNQNDEEIDDVTKDTNDNQEKTDVDVNKDTNQLTPDYTKMYKITDTLYISKAPGIYNSTKSFTVKFYTTNEDAILYYSVNNGIVDFKESNKYTFSSPINISSNLVDDLSYYPLYTSVDGLLNGYGDSRCYSYRFIDNIQNLKEYHLMPKQRSISIKYIDNDLEINKTLSYYLSDLELTIPVVFLTISQKDFMEFYNNIYDDISKRCYLEYYDPISHEEFSLNTKIKLGGNWSKGYPQRTLNLNFSKDEYGNKNIPVTCSIFKEKYKDGYNDQLLTNITRLRLHNGGNTFEESLWFNDALMQRAMEGTNVSTTSYRPCIVYINDEYFGLYGIREQYSDVFFEDNYNVNKKYVSVYELQGSINYDDGNDEGIQYLESLNDFISEHSTFTDEDLENLRNNYIDLDSLIDYIIVESYCCNWDSLGNFNNMKMWISTKNSSSNKYMDSKWRFGLHDLDFAFRSNEEYLSKNNVYSYSKFPLVGKLLSNETFKGLLLDRAKELINTNLSSTNLINIITEMKNEIIDYKLDSFLMYGSNLTDYQNWIKECDDIVYFIQYRSSNYIYNLENILKEY